MTSVNELVKTKIVVKTIDATGALLDRRTMQNEIVNEGVSVIARLLVDPSSARPSHIYARFADDASDAQGTSNLGVNNPAVNIGDFVPQTGSGGTIREPIFSTAKVEANGDIVDGRVTFFFRLTEDSELTGSYTTGSSKIFYLGLAAARDISDYNQDMLMSLISVEEPIEIPTGGQVAIDYTLTFSA